MFAIHDCALGLSPVTSYSGVKTSVFFSPSPWSIVTARGDGRARGSCLGVKGTCPGVRGVDP